jgi:hypothetical protein
MVRVMVMVVVIVMVRVIVRVMAVAALVKSLSFQTCYFPELVDMGTLEGRVSSLSLSLSLLALIITT